MSENDKLKIIMSLLLTSFVTLNPEIEKFQYVNNYKYIEPTYSERIFDLKSVYLVCNDVKSKNDFLKDKIDFFHKSKELDLKISSRVLINSHNLLDILSPLLLEELDLNNVYTTSYGTLVLDWEKDENNVFSLELGADRIGYFIEVDGIDEKKVDNIYLEDNKKELLQDLSSFLLK